MLLMLLQPYHIKNPGGPFHTDILVHALKGQGKRHIFHRIHGSHQIKGLENETDMLPAELYQLVLRLIFHVLPGNDNLTLRRLLQTGKHVQKR